jgi:hypothetical protein
VETLETQAESIEVKGQQVRGDLALRDDDVELRRLLRDNPLQGAISVSMEREPDFFLGSTVEGEVHQTIVGRVVGQEQRLIGLGSRSVRDAWLDGEVGRLGYLSALRIDRAYRGGGGALKEGYRIMRELHEQHGDTPYYVTTIIADNKVARGVLERDRSWKPKYHRWGAISTLVLPVIFPRLRPRLWGVEVRRATADMAGDVADCLQRCYRNHQFAPCWTPENLTDGKLCRGLRIEDFTVALKAGKVVGCVAAWDQLAFKQTVVRGYKGWMRRIQPVVGRVGPLLRWPGMPEPGSTLRQVFLSHLAVDGDDPGLGLTLLTSAFNRLVGRGYAFATTGLAEGNPLLPAVKRAFWNIEYRSILYLVYWEDGAEAAQMLDNRPPHLEVATL